MQLKKYKTLRAVLVIILSGIVLSVSNAQDGYGNQWIFGRNSTPNPSGTLLNFNDGTPQAAYFNKPMELEASCAVMCDSVGKLLFYSNGCYIANANHQMMINGGGLGKTYWRPVFAIREEIQCIKGSSRCLNRAATTCTTFFIQILVIPTLLPPIHPCAKLAL